MDLLTIFLIAAISLVITLLFSWYTEKKRRTMFFYLEGGQIKCCNIHVKYDNLPKLGYLFDAPVVTKTDQGVYLGKLNGYHIVTRLGDNLCGCESLASLVATIENTMNGGERG